MKKKTLKIKDVGEIYSTSGSKTKGGQIAAWIRNNGRSLEDPDGAVNALLDIREYQDKCRQAGICPGCRNPKDWCNCSSHSEKYGPYDRS